MRRLRRLWPFLAVLAAIAAITVPPVLAGHRPKDIKMSEITPINPAAAAACQTATFALG
jgi:hypothetical protein